MNHDTEGTKNMEDRDRKEQDTIESLVASVKSFDQDDRSTWPKAWKHSVTLPDGKVATRNSKAKQYSHAVVIQINLTWGVIRWSQNELNATKALNGFMTQAGYRNGRVVEVTQDWTN